MMPRILLTILLILFSACTKADVSARQNPLHPDQAFALSVKLPTPKKLMVQWHVAPGYYLYREQLKIKLIPSKEEKIKKINWPATTTKKDSIRGRFPVYMGTVSIPVTLQGVSYGDKLHIQVNYQGCSKHGFCYPPTEKMIALSAGANQTPVFTTQLLENQDGITTFLEQNSLLINLLVFLALGMLLALTPCVLPMVPILSGIILGQGTKLNTRRAFILSLAYVLGTAITYMIAGLFVAWLGSSVQSTLQTPWVLFTFSGLFVLLALSLFDVYTIQLPRKLNNTLNAITQKQRGGTYLGVFFMGVFSSLIVSPCVSAPLVGVLAYISQSGNMLLGGMALFALGLGMGIPLLLLGVSAGKWLPRGGPWMDTVKKLWGFLMLGVAIWLMSRVIPLTLTLLLSALLIVSVALFLSFFSPVNRSWPKLTKLTGTMVGAYGLLLFAGVTQGTADPVHPWRSSTEMTASQKLSFTVVRNEAQLRQKLNAAQKAGKPVLLDYYADWCDSCLSMERNVFHRAQVKKALQGMVLLRVDLTNNTRDDEELMRLHQVIAPPTVLLFDKNGEEITSQRIVGEVSEEDFLSRLKQAASE